MHAVFTVVSYLPGATEDAAVKSLHDDILPMITQAPGFVKGTWFGDDKSGHGLVLFDTEEHAQQGLQPVGSTSADVTVVSSEVYRLHGEAP